MLRALGESPCIMRVPSDLGGIKEELPMSGTKFKRLTHRGLLAAASAALLSSVFAVPAYSAEVTQERLENADAEPENWLTVFQNYSSHRFSRLDEINRDTVDGLKLAFAVSLPTAREGTADANLENAPLVIDGMLYVNDAWGNLYKVDVSSGTAGIVQWVSDPAMDKEGSVGIRTTRGIAAFGNNIYQNLVDGRVVSMDAETGELLFDELIARTEENWDYDAIEGFTAAPLAVDGKILVGQSMGDWGTRGWLAAVDAESGEELWRRYVVPGEGEPGNETWVDDHDAWRTGGGALWTTGSYDPETRTTIWGTANPVPMFDPEIRPGDNLFTSSALGINVDSGEIDWYFQYTPNEAWDFDEIGVHLLYDSEIDGDTRNVVGHFGRNGFFYQLDRNNGSYIGSTQYVSEVNWTAGIDSKTGLPVEYDPSLAVQTYIPETRISRDNPNVDFCPTMLGGVRWQPPAFNPDTRLAYAAGGDGCTTLQNEPSEPVGPEGGNPRGVGQVWLGGSYTNTEVGRFAAVNVDTGETVVTRETPHHNLSGLLATAGGLLFTGEQDGTVVAMDDQTLETLWTFNGGIPFKAPPISYAVDGKQYIAIVAGASGGGGYEDLNSQGTRAGSMLYVFSL